MSHSNNNPELVQELSNSLKVTSTLIQSLLDEIKGNSTSLAVLKEQLGHLKDTVDGLSNIVKDGNGRDSLNTRLALVEQAIHNIEQQLEGFREAQEAETSMQMSTQRMEELVRAEKVNKIKIAAVAIPGLVSLIIIIIKLIVGQGAE